MRLCRELRAGNGARHGLCGNFQATCGQICATHAATMVSFLPFLLFSKLPTTEALRGSGKESVWDVLLKTYNFST
jgi:hypothetical protein